MKTQEQIKLRKKLRQNIHLYSIIFCPEPLKTLVQRDGPFCRKIEFLHEKLTLTFHLFLSFKLQGQCKRNVRRLWMLYSTLLLCTVWSMVSSSFGMKIRLGNWGMPKLVGAREITLEWLIFSITKLSFLYWAASLDSWRFVSDKQE